MARKDVIQIRVSEEEKEKLEAIAQKERSTKSEILREHIKNLPDPREKP
jgi:predicted DNA-binding protein